MTMTARFPGTCTVCKSRMPAGTLVVWTRPTVRHAHLSECHAAQAAAVTTPPAAPITLALTPIADFLTAAATRGLRRPVLRVLNVAKTGELRVSLTRTGSAPGTVSVQSNGAWLGSVRPDGEVRGPMAYDLPLQAHLLGVAADPAAAAKSYAALMGRCSFCALPLTDAGSVEVGYGPVCADHWGLPHTAKGTPALHVPTTATAPLSHVAVAPMSLVARVGSDNAAWVAAQGQGGRW